MNRPVLLKPVNRRFWLEPPGSLPVPISPPVSLGPSSSCRHRAAGTTRAGRPPDSAPPPPRAAPPTAAPRLSATSEAGTPNRLLPRPPPAHARRSGRVAVIEDGLLVGSHLSPVPRLLTRPAAARRLVVVRPPDLISRIREKSSGTSGIGGEAPRVTAAVAPQLEHGPPPPLPSKSTGCRRLRSPS